MIHDTSKRIIYARPDGGVSIVAPSGELSIEDVMLFDVESDAIDPRIVPVEFIPSDRMFRNAWELSGGEIVVNFAKAKVIADEWRRRWLREARLNQDVDDDGEGLKLRYGRLKASIASCTDLNALREIMLDMGDPP